MLVCVCVCVCVCARARARCIYACALMYDGPKAFPETTDAAHVCMLVCARIVRVLCAYCMYACAHMLDGPKAFPETIDAAYQLSSLFPPPLVNPQSILPRYTDDSHHAAVRTHTHTLPQFQNQRIYLSSCCHLP